MSFSNEVVTWRLSLLYVVIRSIVLCVESQLFYFLSPWALANIPALGILLFAINSYVPTKAIRYGPNVLRTAQYNAAKLAPRHHTEIPSASNRCKMLAKSITWETAIRLFIAAGLIVGKK